MKRAILSVLAGAFLLGGGFTARADEPFNPDCHLQGINRDLDSVMAQIHSSPAWGYAGGHYAKAEEELRHVKENLHTGCREWNHSLHRR
jgi:hypothetical protein